MVVYAQAAVAYVRNVMNKYDEFRETVKQSPYHLLPMSRIH